MNSSFGATLAFKLAFVISWMIHAITSEHTCPEVPLVKVCKCEVDSINGIKVTCTGQGLSSEFLKELRQYNNTEIEHLLVNNMIFSDQLPFDGLRVKLLDIRFCEFASWSKSFPLTGLKDLSDFRLSDCYIANEFDWKHFETFPDLTVSKFYDVNVSEFKNWDNFKAIKWHSLDLHEVGGLKELINKEPTLLSTSHDLKMVSFVDIGLTEISRAFLPQNANNLELLDFSFNSISSIPPDLFQGMPKLKALLLEYTELATISSEAFAPVLPQLKFFRIEGINLVCDSKVKWLLTHMKNGVKIRTNDINKLKCKSPEKLANRIFHSLLESDLD